MGKGPLRGRELAIRLAACAVIGADVTVATAWLITIRVSPDTRETELPAARWPVRVDAGWPAPEAVYQAEGFGVRRRVWRRLDEWDFYYVERKKTGLPLVAMQCTQRERQRRTVESSPGTRIDDGMRVPDWVLEYCGGSVASLAVPSWPLFPGFALDTAFYAANALTLWSAPGMIRRRLRRARGRCPACGYDLKGAQLPECPECGSKREGVAEGRGGEEVPSA